MTERTSDSEKLRNPGSENQPRKIRSIGPTQEITSISRQRIKEGFKIRFAECVMRRGSVYALSKASKIPIQTLQRYQKGSEPSLTILVSIADAAAVRVEWLATGRGPKLKQPDVSSENLRDPRIQAAFEQLIESVTRIPAVQGQ